MNAKSLLSKLCALWLLLVFSIHPVVAGEQHPSENQFKAMSPRELIRSWDKAARIERSKIEDALFENRSLSLPALRDALLTGSSQEKMLAAALLAEMRDKDSVDTLLAATGDPDQKVQVRAIIALRDIGGAEAAPRLRELARKTQGGPVLKSSLAALAKLGSPMDIPVIRPWLSDPDESVRVNAAAALAMLGSSEGHSILLESTRSENTLPRVEAIVALGYLNTPQTRRRLEEIVNDPNSQWKSRARVALAMQDLTAKSTEEKAEYLKFLAHDSNRHVASWAVEQLADLDTPETVSILRALKSEGGRIGERAHRILKLREVR